MLFALLMLVLVVAAIATMSLSHLTQQKMEMQVANDAAAYSQAVAAARTYNSVALLNRAQVATMVALQGIHSAISFAGTYRGAINSTMFAYEDDFNGEFGKCGTWEYQINWTGQVNTGNGQRNTCELLDRMAHEDSCARAHPLDISIFGFHIRFDFACIGEACDARREVMGEYGFLALNCDMQLGASGGRVPLLKDEWCRVKKVWNLLDDMTGWQGRNAQAEAIALGEKERVALEQTLPGALQPLASASAGVVNASVDTSVGVSEVGKSFAGGGSYNGVEAALGSRAHPFISRREDGRRAIEEQLRLVIAAAGAGPDEVQVLPDFKGSSFFDEPAWGAATYSYSHGQRDPSAFASWADEHGRVSVSYNGPRANQREPGVADTRHIRTFRGSQSATDEQHQGDTHQWCPADLNAESSDPFVRHTLLPHKMPPPNEPDPCENTSCIWPGFYDINATYVASPGDVFGQPKLLTVATRDLAGTKDPWNLFFKIQATQGSSGAQVDFRAKHAVAGALPSFQALSSGMAYYHRPGHWKEHPNLFNPYWRATLVRSNLKGLQLNGLLAGSNQDAVNALTAGNIGYRGIP